jgi:cell wall-associated NlpC family hydrolase
VGSSGSASAAAIARRSSSDGSGVISNSTAKQTKVDRDLGRCELTVGRRLLFAALCSALVPAAATAAPGAKPVPWATREIQAVTAAGLLGATDAKSFRPDDPLTAQALENLVFDLKQRVAPPVVAPPVVPTDPVTVTDPGTTTAPTTAPTTTTTTTAPTTTTVPATTVPAAPKQVANPDRPVTMTTLDARLVAALGLGKAANTFARNARLAGLKVPARFGTEVVARLLGLRLNHPASQDSLELLPTDAATRAEAAYSAAQILNFDGWEVDGIQSLADAFLLPDLTDWQTQILDTAVARIGMPYVWGGTSDGPETEFGVSSRGGYDCSGFVWRVYKLQPYEGSGGLNAVLRGRTTFQMSGEVPRSERIGLAKLEPADVIFFGDQGPRSNPAQVGHMGIYLGNGWFIHSSEYGVAVARLDGWYAREFAWARRPLAEAGLEG